MFTMPISWPASFISPVMWAMARYVVTEPLHKLQRAEYNRVAIKLLRSSPTGFGCGKLTIWSRFTLMIAPAFPMKGSQDATGRGPQSPNLGVVLNELL